MPSSFVARSKSQFATYSITVEYSRLSTDIITPEEMSTRPQLWTTEAEIEEDLAEVDINLALGNYGQGQGVYDVGAPPMLNDTTLLAMQQQMAQQAAFSQIPDVVKRFIIHFHQAVLEQNVPEITVAYETGWNRLTEKYYAKQEWPEAEVIAPLVGDDPIFLILYRELYYRHVYSRLSPDIDDRFHSYENSCELFNYLLNSDAPPPLSLPDQWLWDIIDEFIYQFQSFSVWRSRVRQKSEEEVQLLAEGGQVWSCYSVLNVLYSFIQKSKINEHIVAVQRGASSEEIEEIVGEYGSKPLYKMLGYFSIIGLLRVHTLLGDYTLALRVMDNIELNQKAFFTRVTACHVATYYYVGFCYLALRRYPDATRTFVSILNFILRMRSYHTRSYQYDQINKTADRMYALFAICNALSPSRLDDNILNIVKDRYGEQVTRMSRGEEGLPAFEELFIYACPKFISANPPPYHDPALLSTYLATPSPSLEPAQHHLVLFLSDVRGQLAVPTLRSFLKLYTSLDAKKLAGFLDKDEEDVVQEMMVMKQSSRSVSRMVGGDKEKAGDDRNGTGAPGGLLDGQTISTSDLDFVIDENMVHIAESTVGRRYAGWFIRNTEHAQRVLDALRASPLPISTTGGAANAGATGLKTTPPTSTPKPAWGSVKKVEVVG
ncbi:eukaryotic translation initiation factor 3 subunit 6 [Gautieria morchelliformis]|nr:eukaryotic translation initiation factor 3 subunit 6 [Gautieria morchelliformis]